MRSHLHNRVSKIEQALGGVITADRQDPKYVEFCAAFGIPADKVPYGVSIESILPELAKAVQGNSIGPVA